MWRLLIFFLLYICFQQGRCHLSNNFKTEVTSLVEDMMKEYTLTTEHLLSEVARLSSVVADQQKKISVLEHKVNVLTEKEDTEVEVENRQTDDPRREISSVTEHKENASEYEPNVKHNASPSRTLNDRKNIGVANNVIHVHEATHTNKRQVSENVAFCAYLDHNLYHLGIGQVIKYDQMHLNDRSGYNTHTGIFTAPETGVYLFTFFFNTHVGKTEIRLVIDDVNIVGSVVDHGTGSNQNNLVGGNSAIVRVTSGQAVWTEPYYVGDQEIDSQHGYRKTTFSGVLLYLTE